MGSRGAIAWVVTVLIATLALAPPAPGKKFVATSQADTAPNACTRSDCTLREAILAANDRPGKDVVLLKSGATYELTIGGEGEEAGETGDLDVRGPLTLRPTGKKRATISGDALPCCDRLLHVQDQAKVVRLVLEGGSTTIFDDDGGAIRADADVKVVGSVLKDNLAINQGGAISTQDAGGDGASITVKRSRVVDNTGGGSALMSYGSGGIVVERSTISGNSGEAIRDEGDGGVTVTRSKLVGLNQLDEDGVFEAGPGPVAIKDSEILSFGGEGVLEQADGSLRLTGTTVAETVGEGVQEQGDGDLVILGSELRTVGTNGLDGAQEFSDGHMRVVGTTIEDVGDDAVQEFSSFGVPGDLTVKRSTIDGSGGEGIEEFATGHLKVIRTVVANTGLEGISEFGGGRMTIDRTTVVGSDDVGVEVGDGAATITNSTIAGNENSDGDGGGILNRGDLLLVNSTVASNSATGHGGGIFNDGSASAQLRNVTILGNLADADAAGDEDGGGITGDEFDTVNTLIAANTLGGAGGGPDCADDLGSRGSNLIGDATGCDGLQPEDLVEPNPGTKPLADNGGPTRTIALKKSSPAVDAASKAYAPTRDQRGAKRGKKPDIGAFVR